MNSTIATVTAAAAAESECSNTTPLPVQEKKKRNVSDTTLLSKANKKIESLEKKVAKYKEDIDNLKAHIKQMKHINGRLARIPKA